MTSKEVIKNKIASLEDDYQHYTMVDKDKVKAHFIKIDIEEHQQILQDLDRLEKLEKENQELIEALKTPMNDQIYYRYEELKKEYQELIRKADCCIWLECNKISEENEKLKRALKIYRSNVAVYEENGIYYIACCDGGCKGEEITKEEYETLKEVLENE